MTDSVFKVKSFLKIIIVAPNSNFCPSILLSTIHIDLAYTMNHLSSVNISLASNLFITHKLLRTTMFNFHMDRVKRICVFEHSVMINFNCACPAIQRGQGSGFLSEGSSSLTACMSEQRRFWRDCANAQARLNLRCSHRR